MKVHVYWNLNRDTYSIRHAGKVIGYADDVSLTDATFKVQAGGRATVLRTRCKLVHAWVIGELSETPVTATTPITYNPYLHQTFVRRDNGAAVTSAAKVRMLKVNGKAHVCVD
jgi:hypothetical protein